MDHIQGILFLAGSNISYKSDKVKCVSFLSRKEINELYNESKLGIVLYLPAANHFEAQPIKMFEYMAAGIPFVCSNFDLWKNIVEKNKCGICVDPTKSEEIVEACNYLLTHDNEAQEMGKNGRECVERCFNWENEEYKLVNFYSQLIAIKQ